MLRPEARDAVPDAGRGAVLALLAALAFAHALTFPALVALVAAYGVGAAFFTPAFESIVPTIVAPAELAQANALDQFVRPVALRLAGPALGGWLVGALGAGPAFVLDAGSFAACAASLLAMRAARAPGAGADVPPASTLAAIGDGLRFVRGRVWLWGTLASAAAAYLVFLGPTEVLLPYVVKNSLHGSAGDLGLVFAAGGVGAVAAAAIMGQRGQPRRDVTFIYACWTVATLVVVGYGLGRTVPQLLLACLLFNALEAAGTIAWSTLKQRHVPPHLLG
jgi:MFS family permease